MQKYGIDGKQHRNRNNDVDCNNSSDEEGGGNNNIRLGPNNILEIDGDDDWDRFMDITNDNIANVSFSANSDAINGGVVVGYNTPSPDQSSSDDDSSGNYFFENKAAIQSLATPEKFRYKFGEERERTKTWGLTYARGIHNHQDHGGGSSESDDSPNRSATNVSSTSTGSVLERMFQTVLRFNDDFDDQLSSDESVSEEDDGDDDQSSSVDDQVQHKNSSVSFAADTSFGFNEDFDDQFPSFMNENESPTLYAVDRSSDREDSSDKNTSISFAADTSFATSESKFPSSSSFSFSPNKRRDVTTNNASSSASSTPRQRMYRNSGAKTTASPPSIGSRVKRQSDPTNFALSGLSPIGSLGAEGRLKSPMAVPFDKTPVLDEVPALPPPDDDCQSQCYPADECTNRKLFHETQCKSSSTPYLDHKKHHDRMDVMQSKSFDHCCTTQTTVESSSVESFYETTISTSLSEEVSPFSYSRTFGSNAAFRINSTILATTIPKTSGTAYDNIAEFGPSENRRGVRLVRSDKLRALGLGYKLSQSNNTSPEEHGEYSF